ncbi:MAG: histidine phosphatase family protein [Anaerolineales bacterium]|jgi:phosphohistidine phosphatase
MKTVILMRHAKSSWKDPNLADHDRPLNKRGKRDAPRMGELLNAEDLIPDTIFCSTANRAKSTVKKLLKSCNFEGEVTYTGSLYHGGPEDFFEILSSLPDDIETVMLVGHNPDMEYFLDLTCDVQEHMPTAAIAVITFPLDHWFDISDGEEGKLVHLWKPRKLTQI